MSLDRIKLAPDTVAYADGKTHKLVVEFAIPGASTDTIDVKILGERSVFTKFWQDEGGAIISAELILILTILVIGLIVGLKTLQNALVTEFADVGGALGSLNQSFRFSSVRAADTNAGGLSATTAGSSFLDNTDTCDTGSSPGPGNSQGVVVSGLAPIPEGGTL
jgi:Flp pilus assembly pilin Flp